MIAKNGSFVKRWGHPLYWYRNLFFSAMQTSDLNILFSPKSIAVIGASTTPGSVGNDIAKNLTQGEFAGETFLVNPKTTELFGVPCYPDLASVPGTPELAIIIVPAAIVPEVLRQSGEKGIRAAAIISAGFKETGPDGKVLEDTVATIAGQYGIALLGPNCLGFLHPKIGLNASFAPVLPDDGPVAFFSQSGALCTAMLDLARGEVGFSKFVSTGNKAVIDEKALLTFFAEDDSTKVVSFYSENLTDAAAIVEIGRSAISRAEPKPIIGLKSGRSESGIKATSSHTGALAGSEAAYESIFRQSRMLRADTLRELLDAVSIFSKNPLPRGSSVAIITNAGGPGVLATDAASRAGLTLAALSDDTKAALHRALPQAASVENPVDVLGDAKSDRYRAALELVSAEEGVDSLLVILTPQSMTEAEETARAIVETKRSCGKPVVAVFAGSSLLEAGAEILREAGVSVFAYPEEGAKALGSMAQVAKWRSGGFSAKREFPDIDRDRAKEIFARVFAEERTMLYEREAYEVLRAYGFPILRSTYVRSPEEADKAAREIGRPVVLKIVSPDIIHKTELGGVMLNVAPEEAGQKFGELLHRVRMKAPEARLEGAMIVEMAMSGGKELIFGAKQEPGLGTVLVVGMGGIYTEVLNDASFRFAPIVREDALEMLSELRSASILDGARGEARIDTDHIVELLERLSRLVEDFPEIRELDINPVNVFPDADNFRVIDARIAIGK